MERDFFGMTGMSYIYGESSNGDICRPKTENRRAKWETANYNITSIHDDFKTIYVYNVIKAYFHWDD